MGSFTQFRHLTPVVVGLTTAALLVACAGESGMDPAPPPALVLLKSVGPETVLPNTKVVVEGDNLTGSAEHFLVLTGAAPRSGHFEQTIPLEVDADEPGRGTCSIDAQLFSAVGEGLFSGNAMVVSRNDRSEVRGPPLQLSLQFVRHLTPVVGQVGNGVVFLNTEVPVEGSSLLAGGSEGTTAAELNGCFIPKGEGSVCNGNNVQASVPIVLEDANRTRGSFLFEPAIAGLKPGRFQGTVTIANQHPDGTVLRSNAIQAQFHLEPTHLTGFEQSVVSIGQLLRVQGRGFIDGSSLRFDGSFTNSQGESRAVKFEIVLDSERGGLGMAVVSEVGGIGSAIKLRGTKAPGAPWDPGETGLLNGSWTPVTRYGSQQELGETVTLSLSIGAVKQVLWVRFTEAWYDALKSFGLQAADQPLRQRVVEIFERDYAGVNVDVRLEEPKDFKLYARLDVVARNPNNGVGVGLDATPGKDQYNQKLHDVVGGYHAETSVSSTDDKGPCRPDGTCGGALYCNPRTNRCGKKFAPYGGVFAEAMLSMSLHPPQGVWRWPSLQTPLFDEIFDPVRPDRGIPASSAEVNAAAGLPSTAMCPGSDRQTQVGCAVRVLGNLIGHTAVHEFAHTLGLAQPTNPGTKGEDTHNPGSMGRIMDGGSARSFPQRAELNGQGPTVFCQSNFEYLQQILPSTAPPPNLVRPPCF